MFVDGWTGRDSKGLPLLHYLWRMQPGGERAGWLGYQKMDGNGGKNQMFSRLISGKLYYYEQTGSELEEIRMIRAKNMAIY